MSLITANRSTGPGIRVWRTKLLTQLADAGVIEFPETVQLKGSREVQYVVRPLDQMGTPHGEWRLLSKQEVELWVIGLLDALHAVDDPRADRVADLRAELTVSADRRPA